MNFIPREHKDTHIHRQTHTHTLNWTISTAFETLVPPLHPGQFPASDMKYTDPFLSTRGADGTAFFTGP